MPSESLTRLLWRLRSPLSKQVRECYLLAHSPDASELHFVQIPPGPTEISPLRFVGMVEAVKGAAVVATALRADGFTPDPG